MFGQISGSAEVTSSVTINSLFENLLGRAAQAPALAFFGGEMAAGQTIANIASQIYTDVLNESATSQDNMVLTDKIAYANNYTGYLGANPSFTYSTPNARAYINQVTTAGVMTGTVPTGANMPAVGSFVAGTIVPLVASSTSYIEPVSNGIVNFVADASTAPLMSDLKADNIQSGAGGATLTINNPSAALTNGLPAMSGVSTILINDDFASDNLNISGIAGVTSLIIDKVAGSGPSYTAAASQSVSLESIAAGDTINVNSTGTSANVTLYNDGSSITAMTLDVNTAAAPDNAMATLNLTVSGSNYVSLTDSASTATLAALTVASTDTSAKDSTTITGIGNIDSVNAGADQGTLTYVMPTSLTNTGNTFTFTGGTGTDTVQLTAAPQSAVTYAFTGNSAGTNTLAFDYASPAASDIKTYTNDATHFTGLAFMGGVTSLPTIDMANMNSSINNVTFSSTATVITVSDATGTGSTGTVGDMFNVNQAVTTLTISDASGSNAANLTMGGVTVAALDVYQSPVAGIAPQLYINIDSAGKSINTITALNVADGATVTVTGSESLAVSNLADKTTSTSGVTFNAASFTGMLALTDSNTTAGQNDKIILGSGNSTIATATDSDTINTTNTLAANTDYITSYAIYDTSSPATTPDNITTITNSAGTYSNVNLTFSADIASAAPVPGQYTFSAAPSSAAKAISTVITALQTADAGSIKDSADQFQYGGNTYIVNDNNAYSGSNYYTDQVVMMSGLVTASTALPAYGYTSASGGTVVNITPGSTTTWGDLNYTFNIATTVSTAASTTLTAGNGNDTVNIASATTTDTGANTITLGNTTAGAGNDTIVSYGTGAATFTLGTSGSTGNDSITMYGANTAADTFTITSTGTDSVTMGNSGASASTAGNTITITGGAGLDTVTMTGGNSALNEVTVHGGAAGVDVSMTGADIGGNTIVVTSGAGNASVTLTGADTGTNSITVSGSGTDTVSVSQNNYTIDLSGTSGPAAISIGQGANTITLGSGADSINMTTLYSTTAGANTLNGVITGDTLVFNHSADTAAAVLTTTATTATTQTTLGTEGSATTVTAEITALQTIDNVAGFTTVGWLGISGNDYVVMNHALTATTWVDQVIQIVGTPAYISATTGVSLVSGHVSVAL